MFARAAVLVAIQVLAAGAVFAQDPVTRAESLAREREEKSERLAPPEQGRLERTLLMLENGRLFERVLNPPEGLYPKIGNVTAGSGFALGPAYRKPAVFGQPGDFTAFALASFKRYWLLDARVTWPALARGRVFADVHGRLFEYPQEDFFGIGPDSDRLDDVVYGIRSSEVGAMAGVRPTPWLSLGAKVDHLTPTVGPGSGGRSIGQVFTPTAVPGLAGQPDFLRYELLADVNLREPRGNPRSGGQYKLLYQQFDDRDLGRYSFHRVEVDLQQYVPILRDRRVLAVRALASAADAGEGNDVPFYYQRTLGGPDDLRGFRQFRFRDRNILLLQAEYRWEIFTAVDGAVFYDAGQVAPRFEDLSLGDLESDYGIGFRFGTRNGVFLRIEGAFGSSGGKHFILRYGHVF
jgi:hypothetical protein